MKEKIDHTHFQFNEEGGGGVELLKGLIKPSYLACEH